MERTGTKNSSAKTGSFVLSNPFGQSLQIGFLNLRFYSLTYVAAIVAAYYIARQRIKKIGLAEKAIDDILFWVIIIGFLSARLYYVIFYFSEFSGNFSEVFKIWHGGLSIYGGVLGGIATLWYLSRKQNFSFWKFADAAVLALPIGQAIGRLGNYFNNEAFGLPTDLAWKLYVPEQNRPAKYASSMYFHPAFLYEILWNLLVFIFLYFSQRRIKNPGMLIATYLFLYSIGRFAIEAIRLDSAYLLGLKVDQIVALLLILTSLAIMAYSKKFGYNRT